MIFCRLATATLLASVAIGVLTGAPQVAQAADNPLKRALFPPKWTATFGLQAGDSEFTKPSSTSESTTVSTSATLMYMVDQATYVGGNFAYSHTDIEAGTNSGNGSAKAYAGGIFALRALDPNWLIDGSFGYGSVLLDNSYNTGTRIDYNADTAFWSAGAGLTRLFRISPALTASLSARGTYTHRKSASYTDSAGAVTTPTARSLAYISPGGALNWKLGNWEPYTKLNWNLADKDFNAGAGDNDYFSYGFGSGYALTQDTKISLGFSGVLDKAYSNERTLLLSISTKF
jgi:hypothetical protein